MIVFLGMDKSKFTAQDTGEVIHGWDFWFNEPNSFEQSIGYKPFKKFLSDNAVKDVVAPHGGIQSMALFVGKDCDIVFNRYGRIDAIKFSVSKPVDKP